MMKREWDILFHDNDLRGTLEGQRNEAIKRVRQIPTDRLLSGDQESLARELIEALTVNPLGLDEGGITVETREADIDVRYDWGRDIYDRDEPTYVRGLEVTYYLPFTGDRELLKCQPSTITTVYARANIRDNELTFPYDSANRDVTATKNQFDEDLRDLRRWVSWVNQDVEEFNKTLPAVIQRELTGRRQTLVNSMEQVASLGYKAREKPAAPRVAALPQPATAAKPRAAKKADDQYDVAFSFAGEDRGYVSKVADILKGKVSIFYDDYEEVGMWGKNLADHLGEVYSNRSRFVVMFVSTHYAAKVWPTYERQQAQSKAIKQRTEYILPARFDDTEIPGMPSTIAYLDLRKLTPAEFAEKILKKLGK